MENLISVIIPVYKVEQYLDDCVASVVGQTYQNLEIILVDDGSPDNCPTMCDAWAEKDSRIRVIHKQNGGLSDARNVGIAAATGEYIAFVDSDDWIAPEMYLTMYRMLTEQRADICACGITVANLDRQERLNIPDAIGNSEKILAMLYDNTAYPVSAWNKLYRRELWEKFQFPVGKICEDAFTTYLLVNRAKKIVQISMPFYFYRIRPDSIMTTAFRVQRMDEEEAWRCNYEFMDKHYPALKKAAYDFYLLKVNILIHEIPADQRQTFSAEYQKLHNILKKNLCYILFSSRLSLKQRFKLLLDYCRL